MLEQKISIDHIEKICRALGFYPSEKEREDMINEVKYSKFVQEKNESWNEEFELFFFQWE